MYAKDLPVPPKVEFPYQAQQRYSGSFVVTEGAGPRKAFSPQEVAILEENVRRLEPSK